MRRDDLISTLDLRCAVSRIKDNCDVGAVDLNGAVECDSAVAASSVKREELELLVEGAFGGFEVGGVGVGDEDGSLRS